MDSVEWNIVHLNGGWYVLWGPSPVDPTVAIKYEFGSVSECRDEMLYRRGLETDSRVMTVE